MPVSKDVILGCDPEMLFCTNDNTFVPAHTLITKVDSAAFGCDHHPEILEVRQRII